MIKRAEEFAAKDEASRKKIEAINELASFIYNVKTQTADDESWGGKVRLQRPNYTLSLILNPISSATGTNQ